MSTLDFIPSCSAVSVFYFPCHHPVSQPKQGLRCDANIQLLGENSPRKQSSSSQTNCSRDNRPGWDGSQGCFVPFAGWPFTYPSRLGSPQPFLSSLWQFGIHWSLLRFFCTVGHEFSICIHVHTIVSHPVARPHCRFILCLQFFFVVFQLFLLPGLFLCIPPVVPYHPTRTWLHCQSV